MNIGIIGAGALGSNVARLLAKSGISATIANSRVRRRWQDSLESLALSSRLAPFGKPRAPISSSRLYVGSISERRWAVYPPGTVVS
jgi:3-hydroxyacyl-CoA dehydrogenase